MARVEDACSGFRFEWRLRRQWRDGAPVAMLVDLGQDDGELGGNDGGEGAKVKMEK